MKKHIFSGCATALITPFTADKKDVDYKAFEKLLDVQIYNKIDALVIAGTTGEAPVLTSEEKKRLFYLTCKKTEGKLPVIAGTGSNNTEEAVRKSNEAEKEGVNGLLIVTPYYNKCTQEGIIRHYMYIADRVSTPIIVYNVPSRTGVNILPETYKALSEHNNIVAVKEASDNIHDYIRSMSLCEDRLDFYSGNDSLTVPMMSLGAKGVISVASNIIPDIMTKITKQCIDGNFDNATELLLRYLKLINSMFIEVNPIPVKSACNMLFEINDTLRLPLTKISDASKIRLSEILKDFNIL